MLTDVEHKKLSSLMGSLKGTIIQNINPNNFEKFINWCNKLAIDTKKDKLEKSLIKKIKNENNPDEKAKLIQEKRKYLPSNYPTQITIGDIIHINFGYGYCSELSDGHYGVVMSEMKANMYFIIPCSSEPLRVMEFPIKLGVPNKEHDNEKVSYLRFDQMRMIHYRRIERITYNKVYNVGDDNILQIRKQLCEFFNIDIDDFSLE